MPATARIGTSARRFAVALGICWSMFLGQAGSADAAEIYVAPYGVKSNSGTRAQPIDLATALSDKGPARPGDTIWLLGGTYIGIYKSLLRGTPTAPITVRQYPGERATLNGAGSPKSVLEALGEWVVFWGFEITNSDPQRWSAQTGPWPYDLHRGGGVESRGSHLKFINLVVHDLAGGISVWTDSVNTEVYGSLIYYNGWEAPDRGHGHGIYTQNRVGTKLIRENILFSQFSHGIHAYGSGAAYLDNITLEGNVTFNNGILGTGGLQRDILLGGGAVAHNPVLRENFTYGWGQSNLGHGAGCINGTVTNNYLVGSSPLILVECSPVMTGNTFLSWYAAQYGFGSLPIVPQNTYHSRRPGTNVVHVRKNHYEAGRGHVVVYNWERAGHVAVDLSPLELSIGDEYEIRDAQNFFGPRVASGIYTGDRVIVPMVGLTLDPPIGNVPVVPSHTAPDFGVFVAMRVAGGGPVTPPAVAATPTVTPAGGSFSAPVSVTLSSVTAGAEIRYTTDGSVPTNSSPLYVSPLTVSTSTSVRARAFATGMVPSVMATAAFTMSSPGGVPLASYLGTDAATQGTWNPVYGIDGRALATVSTTNPAYGAVIPSGHESHVWAPTTSAVKALQKPTGSDRVAATWYAATSFTIDVNLTDGQLHEVALYGLDWDDVGRSQRIEVLDATTQALLDTRTVGGFTNGQYWVWQVKGSVSFRITKLSGPNAVISGVFLDASSGTPGNLAPTVTLGNPTGGPWTAPATVALSATANDSDGTISQVRFYNGTTLIGTSPTTTSPYTLDWTNVPAGTYTISAQATDNGAATTISAPVTVTVAAPGGGAPLASYLGTDAATQGTWKPVYGADGRALAAVSTTNPVYGAVIPSGHASYVWAATTSAVKALQKPAGTDRVAATWYAATSFTIDVNLTDGQLHRVALYGVDWDSVARSQRIEVLNATTQAVLDTRTVSGFSTGQYWVWQVRGSVRFRITRLSGHNAVISGVFLDPPH